MTDKHSLAIALRKAPGYQEARNAVPLKVGHSHLLPMGLGWSPARFDTVLKASQPRWYFWGVFCAERHLYT